MYRFLLFFICFSQVISQTVTNGSFELSEGVTGWTQANNSTLTHSTTEGKNSTGAAKLVATTNTSYMYQTLSSPTFESESTFRLHYWIKGTAGNKFRTIIIYADPSNAIDGDTYQSNQTFTGDWQELHWQGSFKTGHTSGMDLTIRIQSRTAGQTFYVDDITFTGRTANTWDGSTDSDWNDASNWSLGTVPLSHTQVVIPDVSSASGNDPVISSTGAKAGTVTLYSNTTLTINAGADLTVASNIQSKGDIIIKSTSNSFGSLIANGWSSTGTGQTVDTNTNVSGSEDGITYKRWINDVSSSQGAAGWDLIGSATASSTVSTTGLATNSSNYAIQPYNNANNTWTPTSSATLSVNAGQGYSMGKPNGSAGTHDFVGSMNMTDISYAITELDGNGSNGTQWNLVSNPYPSFIALNAPASSASSATKDFLTYNTSTNDVLGFTNSEEAVYYWDGDSYETHINGGSAVYIAPGQGFFVSSKNENGSSVTFTKTMQTTSSSDDFVSGDNMEDNFAEFTLELSQENLTRNTKFYFSEGATDNLDQGMDASVFSLAHNMIFSRLVENDNGTDFSIQSLSFDEMWDKTIPIGINVLENEEFTITIPHRTTPADLKIYLEDTELNTLTNLVEEDYVLIPQTDMQGVGRYFIHMSADTMNISEVSTSMLNAYKEINANYITIEGLATQSGNTRVGLFNILGGKILDTELDNLTNTHEISINGLSKGIYIIELESANERLTKKLLIQ
tara:strand:+ start:2290 stop:4497 length:2208 start_codon:yes stop_codon:yes gene_type:complete